MSHKILHIDSSPRGEESVSKKLTAQVVDRLKSKRTDLEINHRDISTGLPFVGPETLVGYFSAPADHSPETKKAVATSDQLIKELIEADTLVMGVPMWNFHVPAMVKAWVDLVVRANFTFKVTDEGNYEGIVPSGKKAYLVVTTGGVPVGSDMDMTSKYIVSILNFIGISDVTVIGAGALMGPQGEEVLKAAETQIASL